MLKERLQFSPGRPVIWCDVCGQIIWRPSSMRILRLYYSLAEDTAAYHMHRECIAEFKRTRPGRWDEYGMPSGEASWFLPMSFLSEAGAPLHPKARLHTVSRTPPRTT